jgi:DNA mismatch repair ATPase MutS
MTNNDVSPSRQQYLEIKRAHPNTILFFRLGDFYETFDEDAEIYSARTRYRPDLTHGRQGPARRWLASLSRG